MIIDLSSVHIRRENEEEKGNQWGDFIKYWGFNFTFKWLGIILIDNGTLLFYLLSLN